jgi:hypothetical protein
MRLSITDRNRVLVLGNPASHALSVKIFDIQGRITRESVLAAGAREFSLEGAGVRIVKVYSEETMQQIMIIH